MEQVKINFQGTLYTGQFKEWFNCDLSGDRIGIIICDDGCERAFPCDQIESNEPAKLPEWEQGYFLV